MPLWQQMVSRLKNFIRLFFLKFDKNSGDNSGGATPLPIPNREVKPTSADGTALVTGWKSRTLPDLNLKAPAQICVGAFFILLSVKKKIPIQNFTNVQLN